MHDQTALKLLTKVMNWTEIEDISDAMNRLRILATYKYDFYQGFSPGRQFIESLALWLNQFSEEDRKTALDFVLERLVFISDAEMRHLVEIAYPDIIVPELMHLVSEEYDISLYKLTKITQHKKFGDLKKKSLFLGLSDGARTSEIRRSSNGEISNEQIWQAYELGDEKAEDMLKSLQLSLDDKYNSDQKFNLIWLMDDFSGSGNTYIRYDTESNTYKGKIRKVYEKLHAAKLVDPTHYEVFLLLYTATRQAIDHIVYWTGRFASENGYKPLQVRVILTIEPEIGVKEETDKGFVNLINNKRYYDESASDKHLKVGGTENARFGFASCSLPLVLNHNTPNNSVYLLWGAENNTPKGLFPRISRHVEY